MRNRLSTALLLFLLLPALAAAQTEMRHISRMQAPPPAMGAPGPGMMLPGGMKAPDGLFDQFWQDPAIASQLRLTEAQKQQLDAQALQMKLALIGDGADGMKSFVKLSAILDAEHFDDTAYKQELDALASTAGKTIQNLGDMVAARRRILSAEQYAKLRRIEKAKKAKEAAERSASAQRCTPGHNTPRPGVPGSLTQPMPEGMSIQR